MLQLSAILQRIWKTRDSWLAFVFLGISVYCIVLLREIRQQPAAAPQRVFTIGQRLPNMRADDLDGGKKVDIKWGAEARPSLVYIFRESCVWCGRNMANIRALTATASSQYRIIGLSLSDVQLRHYAEQNQMTFPIYKNMQASDGKPFGADGTPETLIVSASGTITQRWLGAYGGDTQKQIEQAFRTHLPGIATGPGADGYTTAEPISNSSASPQNLN